MDYYLHRYVLEQRAGEVFEKYPDTWLNSKHIRQLVYRMEVGDEYRISSAMKESMTARLRSALRRMESQGKVRSQPSSASGHTLEWRKA